MKQMMRAEERAFARSMARLAVCNHFLPQRIDLERQALGSAFVGGPSALWNVDFDSRGRRIPEGFNYGDLPNLSREMVDRFTTVRPETLDQASRIPGVTSAALTVVRIAIEDQRRRRRGS